MNDFFDKLLKIQSDYFRRMQYLFIFDLISIFTIFFAIFWWLRLDDFLNHFSMPSFIPTSIISPILAFVIAIIGAFLLHRNDHKKNVTLIIENKYPELKEKLRTAYDNRTESNVIVDSLKSLVSDGMTIVSASRLIAASIVVTKIVVVIIVVSTTVTLVSICPNCRAPPDTLTNAYTNVSKTITGNTGAIANITNVPIGPIQNLQNTGSQGNGTIIGKPKIASLEGKNIDLTLISSMGTGFVPSAPSQQLNQFIRSASYPVDVLGSNVSDGGYSILMQKSEADKTLIQEYAVERSKI
jgi:hypothetical protein